MAIIIPSAKTYDRNNPKVRDNVIERIEVGATEILQESDYKVNVKTQKDSISNVSTTADETLPNTNYVKDTSIAYLPREVAAYVEVTPYYSVGKIKVPKVEKNKYVNKVYERLDKDGNPNINYSITYRKKVGTASADLKVSKVQYVGYAYEISNVQKDYSNATIDKDVSISELVDFLSNEYTEFLERPTASQNDISVKASITATDKTNLRDVDFIVYDEYYLLYYKVLSKIEQLKLGYSYSGTNAPEIKSLIGEAILYEPESIEITILGDTITINLEDKIVNVNGDTAKKVHSVDGNELMQTQNYIGDKNTLAIEKMYGATQRAYSLGKETAVIRCSIGDYYDGDNKAISIDKQRNLSTDIATARAVLSGSSYNVRVTLQQAFEKNVKAKISWLNNVGYKVERTLTILAGETVAQTYAGLYRPTNIKVESISLETPMCFEVGDQVIPMVYGANGQDRPMSLYSDMTPKIFQVLAVKPYYDGAVWQELTLQEVAKTE